MNECIEIVVGRPSSGKTLLATHLCRIAERDNQSAIYFAIEVSEKYIKEIYGVSENVEVVDTPNIDWKTIRNIIAQKKPALCVIDYIQLMNGFNENSLNNIIEDFAGEKNNNTKLVILSQCVCEVEKEQRLPLPKDIIGTNMLKTNTEVRVTSIGKITTTY